MENEEHSMARKCFLCATRRTAHPRRLHPYLHMQFFAICTTCDEHLRNPEHLAPYLVDKNTNTENSIPSPTKKKINTDVNGDIDIVSTELENYRKSHISRLIYLCELLIWRSKLPDMNKLREALRRERKDGAYKTPNNLDVDRGVIVCATTLLADVGVAIQDGRLVFPLDTINLPCADEARRAVELSFAISGAHLDVDEVWDNAFPAYPWDGINSSHTIFECLFSLFGLVVEPEKRASRRRILAPTMMLHRKGVESLLLDASQHCPPFFKGLITPLGAPPKYLEEVTHAAFFGKGGIKLPKTTVDFCACCLKISDKEQYPFRMLACDRCERKLCTICLGRVLGTHEIIRAVRLDSYTCPCCRVNAKVNAPNEESRPGEKLRRAKSELLRKRRLQEIMNDGKEVSQPQKKKKRLGPLLCMSKSMAYSIQNVPPGKSHDKRETEDNRPKMNRRQRIGFAKLCEDINFADLRKYYDIGRKDGDNGNGNNVNGIRGEGKKKRLRPMDLTVCMKCKLPLGARVEHKGKLNYNWVVYEPAGKEDIRLKMCWCGVVKHAACFGEDDECQRHKCAKCKGASKFKCRTCTKAFCNKCTPPIRKVHLFSEEWMACDDCREGLEGPRHYYDVDPSISQVQVGTSLADFKMSLLRDRVLANSMVNDIADIHKGIDTRNIDSVRSAVSDIEKNYKRKMYKYHYERARAKERRAEKRKKDL